MSTNHLEPPELDVPQVLARDWINRHGIFRTVSTGGQKERTSTDWGMVITEAARWGQRQGWDARGATKAPAVKDSLTAAQPPAFTEESVQRGNVNGWPSTEKPAIMPKPQCPPLGLKPRWLADEQRLQEVADAINRYRKAGVAIPLEWLDEYDELGRRLQHSSPPQPHGGRMVGPEP
jgi:hypothetical protein